MREKFAFIVGALGLPVSGTVIIVAGIVLAVVILIAALLLFRNTGKSKQSAKTATPGGGATDWQRQAQQQQNVPGAWNQQAMAGAADSQWAPPSANPWNAQNPAQQPSANQWGAQNPAQQPSANQWGAQNPAQQPSANQWGAQNPAQQPSANQWGAQNPAQQPSANAWDGQGMPSPGVGMGGNQSSWNTPFSPQTAQAGDSWAQPQPQAQSQQSVPAWGMPNNPPAQSQVPDRTVLGGSGSGQSWGQSNQSAQPAEPWNAPPAQQPAPPWGMPNNASAQSQPSDRTVLGGSGSGQSWGQSNQTPQPTDPWNMPSAQQSAPVQQGWGQPFQQQVSSTPSTGGNPGMPSPPWQQQGPGQGQGFGGYGSPAMRQDDATAFKNNDGDKTMLRSAGQQGSVGIVRVEEGKEPGRVYEVRKESLSIGRSRESDIFLEDLAVSRLHASIVSMGNGNYALKDEGSANGTKVNGQMVNKYQTFPLQEGDRIQLGQTVLIFARR